MVVCSLSTVKKIATTACACGLLLASVSPLFAAAPDGDGPWADKVKSFSQGLRKDGSTVPAIRSNPDAAVGIAEDDTVEGHFVSLGFDGSIVLKFQKGISNGAFVVEATNNPYPTETVNVEVSKNGKDWYQAGTINQDGSVPLPKELKCGKFVRLTDISNKEDFPDGTADGYDVDGVRREGDPCKKKEKPICRDDKEKKFKKDDKPRKPEYEKDEDGWDVEE